MYILFAAAESARKLFLQSSKSLNVKKCFTKREKLHQARANQATEENIAFFVLLCCTTVCVRGGRDILRLFPLLEVPFRGAPLDNVRDVRLVVKDLHDLRARLVDAVHDDLAALHVALEQLVDPFNFRGLFRAGLHAFEHLV